MRKSSGAPASAGALVLALALLAGCAAQQVQELDARPPPGLPERVELTATPFFPQKEYQCGPAALATALVQAGVDATPQALVPEVYVPDRRGSLQAEMLAATRRHGLIAYVLAPRLEALLREVAAGTPVVILQNLSLPIWPMWHYAVVIGYDRLNDEVILRSGTERRQMMSLTVFEHTWARSGHWAMVALPPGKLPVGAEEDAYVQAAIDLERVDPAAARRAYAGALERWPHDLLARLGLGNTAYAARDLPDAEAAYRRAIADRPDSADAWNNLAQTLLERGQRAQALAAAERAVELGGPRVGEYRATLEEIEAAR
ncbi:MAG: PA2778 family cysteine peptidase [Betaproteobacteria bacterium]|nr:PA2778 family cysteine peptidase [Betaproteobacteria bacterium]